MKRRRYQMGVRAEAVAGRKARIVDVFLERCGALSFEEVTLQVVAERARVSPRTVVRLFGSKEGLLGAAMQRGPAQERARRVVAAGDVAAAARVLGARYEESGRQVVRMVALEDRFPALGQWLGRARRSHLAWLAEVFARWLPARGPVRRRRLLMLFGATELYVWFSWRQRLGHSRQLAEAALRETLDALVERWEREGNLESPRRRP